MKVSTLIIGSTLLLGPAAAVGNEKQYGPGVTDNEIKIGQTVPYSGPASAFGSYGRVMTGYFQMLNEKGGINGRKVNLISLDNAFSPPKPSNRAASSSTMMASSRRSAPSARRPMLRSRSTSTAPRCRTSSFLPVAADSMTRKTSHGPCRSIRLLKWKAAYSPSSF